MSRIIADRLNPRLTTLLQPSQHCGIRGHNVFEALATVRDAIAYAEYSRPKRCLLTLYFKEAFDNISHSYLFTLLKTYGFSPRVQQRIRDVYTNATSSIRINGHISSPVPIMCSIRQGCPLSMQLFAMCLDPLLTTLENMLTGIHTDCHGSRLPDIDPCAGRSFILFYCRFYSGYVSRGRHKCDVISVCENSCLDRATASPWDTSINVTHIPYHTEMKILGIYFTNTVR